MMNSITKACTLIIVLIVRMMNLDDNEDYVKNQMMNSMTKACTWCMMINHNYEDDDYDNYAFGDQAGGYLV